MTREVTYFERYGLQVSFDIDLTELSRRHHELLRKVHPDNFINATNHERLISVQLATEINAGFKVLKSPLERTHYLLELVGFGFSDDTQTEKNPQILFEQMELREQLNDLKVSKATYREVDRFLAHIKQRSQALVAELSQCFALDSAEKYALACTAYTTLKFFDRLKQDTLSVLRDLDAD